MYKKKKKITKKKKKKSSYLQPAVSSVWRKPAVNGYRPKKKKKNVFISRSIIRSGAQFEGDLGEILAIGAEISP